MTYTDEFKKNWKESNMSEPQKRQDVHSRYEILKSRLFKKGIDERFQNYQSDLEKQHINLHVNKKFWNETKGNGDLHSSNYHFAYIYEAIKEFSAGSSRFLEYQFQYSGSVQFNSVVFDVFDGKGLLFKIFEMPKFGKENRFRLHVPFVSDIDPREFRIVIREINRSRCCGKKAESISSEAEKRKHRCFFFCPGSMDEIFPEEIVQTWLSEKIDEAILAGYKTFICGMENGIDVFAGLLVVKKKIWDSSLHLICAIPWSEYIDQMKTSVREPCEYLIKNADLVKYTSNCYYSGVFQGHNEWIVNHCSRLITYYDGLSNGAYEMMKSAVQHGIQVVSNRPGLVYLIKDECLC